MSKEASKKRREAESKLIAELLATLPAFESPRRGSNSSVGNQRRSSANSTGMTYDEVNNYGVPMSLNISATLPTLRYAAVFARKQALLQSMVPMGANYEEMNLDGKGNNDLPRALIQRSELPGLLLVFDPTPRVYPVSNGEPFEISGEMVYVSENVMTYLGHSVQDILSRADSIYDLILPDEQERSKVREIVRQLVVNEERAFLCRFSNALFTRRIRTASTDYKLMLVRARLMMPGPRSNSGPLVTFNCTPILTPLYQRDIDFLVHEPGVFTFKCSPELVVTKVDNRVCQHLCFKDETELLRRSWLNLVHPDDLLAVSEQLKAVLGPNKRDDSATMFVTRMLRAGDARSPTDCIYVSVVLAYRHLGGSTSGNQQTANNTSEDNDDEAFDESCQPCVNITCQVLP